MADSGSLFQDLRRDVKRDGNVDWETTLQLIEAVEATVVYRDKQRRHQASIGDARLLDESLARAAAAIRCDLPNRLDEIAREAQGAVA